MDVQVVHESIDGTQTLATNVETADSTGQQMKGLMFRSSIPEEYALVFEFGEPSWWEIDAFARVRSIHMLFVRFPLDVLWVLDGRVRKVATLQPWRGFGIAKADTIVELPAGTAADVAVGDRIRVEDAE